MNRYTKDKLAGDISTAMIALFVASLIVPTLHSDTVHFRTRAHKASYRCWTESTGERLCGNPTLAPADATDWNDVP